MTVEYFLRADGIDGESTDADHTKWIDVRSYHWGVQASNIDPSNPRSSGRATFADLIVVKSTDAATPELIITSASSKVIANVELEGIRLSGNRPTFIRYVLSDCIVTSVTHDSSNNDHDGQTETVNFAYRTLKVEYIPIDSAGAPGAPITRGWDIRNNREL
jgi:type VI secretion system secreted protein Hcp